MTIGADDDQEKYRRAVQRATYASAIGTIDNPWYASTQNARDDTRE